jgi:DNA-binding CsgD family transcriptional regulator
VNHTATVVASSRLGADIRNLLAEARATLPTMAQATADERAELEGVTRAALSALRDRDADGERALQLGARAQDLLLALHEHQRAHRDALVAGVQQGLRRLAPIAPTAELLDQVCTEAKRRCGLSRVMISRVDGEVWRPWMIDFDDGEIGQQVIDAMRGSAIDLDASPVEQRVLTERRPAIVGRVRPDHVYVPLLGISRSTSFVVVPIAPAGRVVGFLHGDHGPDGPRVDAVDRDVLWVFAEGFGRIYERTDLHERLRVQRARVADAMEVVERTIANVQVAEIELGEVAAASLPVSADDVAPIRTGNRRTITELLTERELEVFEQMVRGLNNAAIADRLVISEGTVKSHVKHILRKLGAINRTEAITLYMMA